MDNRSWIEKSQDGRAALLENRARILTVTAAPGTGNDCAYCHKTIAPVSVEHRVEATVLGKVRTLHFHRVCHHLWESHELDQFAGETHSWNDAARDKTSHS